MAMNFGNIGVGIQLVGQDMFSAVFGKVGNKLLELTSMTRRMDLKLAASAEAFRGLGAAVASVAGTFVKAGLAAAEAGGKFTMFQQAIGDITDTGTERMRDFQKAAFEATSLGFRPQEAIEGLRQISEAGFNASESIDVLNGSAALAKLSLGELGLARSADELGGVMKAFNIDASKTIDVVGMINAAAASTRFSIADFGKAMSHATLASKSTGQSLASTLTILGLERNATASGAIAATSLKNALMNMGFDARKSGLMLHKLGVEVVKSDGKMRDIVDIMLDVNEAMGDGTDATKKDVLFKALNLRGMNVYHAMQKVSIVTTKAFGERMLEGAEAVRYMHLQIRAGSGAFLLNGKRIDGTASEMEKFRSAVMDSGNEVRDMRGDLVKATDREVFFTHAVSFAGGAMQKAQERMANWSAQVTRLGGELEKLGIVFGSTISKEATPVLEIVNDLLKHFAQLMFDLPAPIKKAIIVVLGMTSAILGFLGGLLAIRLAIALLRPLLLFSSLILADFFKTLLILAPVAIGAGAALLIFGAAAGKSGSLMDRVTAAAKRLFLGFEILEGFMAKGFVSGDLAKRALDDQPVLNFARRMHVLVRRVKEFIDGFVDGAAAVAASMKFPALDSLTAKIKNFIGIFTGDPEELASMNPIAGFRTAGEDLAKSLAPIVERFLGFMGAVIRLMGSIWDLASVLSDTLGPAFRIIFGLIFVVMQLLAIGFVLAVSLATDAVTFLIDHLGLSDWSFWGIVIKSIAAIIFLSMVPAMASWAVNALAVNTLVAIHRGLMAANTIVMGLWRLMIIANSASMGDLWTMIKSSTSAIWFQIGVVRVQLGLMAVWRSATLLSASALGVLKMAMTAIASHPLIIILTLLVAVFTGAIKPIYGFAGVLLLAGISAGVLAFGIGGVAVATWATVGAVLALVAAVILLIAYWDDIQNSIAGTYMDIAPAATRSGQAVAPKASVMDQMMGKLGNVTGGLGAFAGMGGMGELGGAGGAGPVGVSPDMMKMLGGMSLGDMSKTGPLSILPSGGGAGVSLPDLTTLTGGGSRKVEIAGRPEMILAPESISALNNALLDALSKKTVAKIYFESTGDTVDILADGSQRVGAGRG
jgi:TP901 family phage tail tape measure protein